MARLQSYLHTHRRQWGLSQREVAFLLGARSGSIVSRLERNERDPSLKVAFACQVIFGAAPIELFPYLFEKVEEELIRRAYELHERLKRNPSKRTDRKLALLKDALRRATERGDNRSL